MEENETLEFKKSTSELKEALVNSFCHRDFQAPESNKIAICKDKIEIWNPGNFPEGYSPEDFIKKETPSILRNPAVANILYLSADIEKWGSGLKRIYEECMENNISVNFNVMKYGFSVVFKRSPIKKGVEKWSEKWSEKVTKRQTEILNLISKDPKISREGLSGKIGINPSAVQKHIQKLKKMGLLKRIGPDKGGHWEVLENGK